MVFSCISGLIFLESSIQCPCGVVLHQHMSFPHFSSTSKSFIVGLYSIFVPKSLSDSLSHCGSRQTMEEEMMTLEKNETWNLISL